MAVCVDCGKKFGFVEARYGGPNANVCLNCNNKAIEAILLTTETAPNLNITKRIDIIAAQAAFEINNFKDMFVNSMNPVKGRSNELEKQLDKLRVKSTQNLKFKAHEIGANAIVAVDLDLSTVTIGGISMMMMMASGTAVVIEADEGVL